MNAPTQLAEMKNTGNAVAASQDVKIDFFSKNGFDLACRVAKAYATSDAVPAAFRSFTEKKGQNGSVTLVENPAAMGNCLVAIEVSQSVGLSTTAVMQNADVIEGKLRWSAKFQIAAVNASRRFSPLRFNLNNLGRIKAKYKEKQGWNSAKKGFDFIDREVEVDNWECVAWAYVLDGRGQPTKEVVQSIPVSMQMAVEEGWYAKAGSKWQTALRFQMLQYRAGSFFASIYAPDVIMGMGRATEDYQDAIDVTPQADGTYSASSTTLQDLRAGTDGGYVDTATGEIHDADDTALKQVEQKQTTRVPPGQTTQAQKEPAAGEWQPSPEELAAIHAQEMAEANTVQPRQRRERGSMNVE